MHYKKVMYEFTDKSQGPVASNFRPRRWRLMKLDNKGSFEMSVNF